MKIICLGDSLTYGFGVRRGEDWVSLSASATGQNLINKGVCGDTTGGMLARLDTDVLSQKPGAVILMGGSNDILTSGTDAYARSNMAAMIQQSSTVGVSVLVGIPIPSDPESVRAGWNELADFAQANRIFRLYAQWLRKYCGIFSTPVVDFAGLFEVPDGVRKELYLDGLHPNIAGHTAMANLLNKRLTEVELI
jgi:lysophospholipase L1-like esterase